MSESSPPHIIGKYELLTRLATGGMAELFLAREKGLAGLERLVVIKRILPHLADQESFVEMFLREARIVARLTHPNVVQIFELGQVDESYFIAMEYIQGSTVRELLLLSQKADLPMPIEVAATVVEQGCRGLHAAHELKDLEGKPLGLVHRDISPHNLMCTSDGHIKLLDFGVAKSTVDGVEATYSGNLKGKFAYLSPEQCLHEPLDRRSDVFSMGIVLWEMWAMRRLFKRRTELEMMQAVIGGQVPRPSQFRPELPEALEEVALKALRTDRDERYATADEMREDLARACEECGVVLGEDGVAKFLRDVAGERLEERQSTVAEAFERALTAAERRRLIHMTGSNSLSRTRDEIEDDAPTVVQRPSLEQAPGESVSASRASVTAAIEESSKGPGRGPRIAMVAVATLVVGAVVLHFSGVFDGDSGVAEGEILEDVEVEEVVVLSGEPLPLGWAPTVDPEVLIEEVEPLHRYLERATGRPVPLVMTRDYRELSQMLLDEEIAFASLPPRLYLETEKSDDEIEILALKEFDGAVSSDALLLVRMDSAVRLLEDLRGSTFCFIDELSTSGYFLPRFFLEKQGEDPDEFIGDVHFSGDHLQAMRDLIEGECDAAAVYSGAFLSADQFGIRTGRMRNLAVTGHIPQDTMTAGSHVSPVDRELVRGALLAFDPTEEFGVERLGTTQRITGFSATTRESFQPLREILFAIADDNEHADESDDGEEE